MRFKNLKVGDTVYCSGEHYCDHRQNVEWRKGIFRVIKSGRKYLTVAKSEEEKEWNQYKIDKETGHSEYKFFLSKEEYLETTERIGIVNAFCNSFRYAYNSPLFGIPLEDLRTAAKLLKVIE